jgi:hypothetical protein
LERTNHRRAALAGKNILNVEGDGLRQSADILDKISYRLTPRLPAADPGKRAIIALDLEHEVIVEHHGDQVLVLAASDPLQKHLRHRDILLLAS